MVALGQQHFSFQCIDTKGVPLNPLDPLCTGLIMTLVHENIRYVLSAETYASVCGYPYMHLRKPMNTFCSIEKITYTSVDCGSA